jgi:hypothetical protein
MSDGLTWPSARCPISGWTCRAVRQAYRSLVDSAVAGSQELRSPLGEPGRHRPQMRYTAFRSLRLLCGAIALACPMCRWVVGSRR